MTKNNFNKVLDKFANKDLFIKKQLLGTKIQN